MVRLQIRCGPDKAQKPSNGGIVRRANAAVLLGLIVFGFAWQTVHYYPQFEIHSRTVLASPVLDEPSASAPLQAKSIDECIACSFRGQSARTAGLSVPEAALPLVVRHSVQTDFFRRVWPASNASSSSRGRAPPVFLS